MLHAGGDKNDLAFWICLADLPGNLDPGCITHINIKENQMIGCMLKGFKKGAFIGKFFDTHMYFMFIAVTAQVVV